MELFGLDLDSDVAVVAEIGVNHEGNVDVAARLVEAVAEAGAHAVKFQSYTPERFVAASNPERLARVRRFALDEAAHRRLAAVATRVGIAFFSAAISEDWVPLIAKLSPAIKIASGDLTFEPVIRAAARTGKPVILSTGAGTVEQIDRAVGWVREEAGSDGLASRLAILHCVSAYPTPIDQTNLRSIPFLKDRYGLTIGWSNHVIGPVACLAAVALGAQIVEVHVTDRREGRDFHDHALSFEAAELARLAADLRDLRASLGKAEKHPQPCEHGMQEMMRKGVVAARDLDAGSVLADGDLMFARTSEGFAPDERERLFGRPLSHKLRLGDPVTPATVGADHETT